MNQRRIPNQPDSNPVPIEVYDEGDWADSEAIDQEEDDWLAMVAAMWDESNVEEEWDQENGGT